MRLKTRPEDVGAHEMSDWIAWLRAEVIEELGAEVSNERRAEVAGEWGTEVTGERRAEVTGDTDDSGDSEAKPTTVAAAAPADRSPASVKTVASREDTCRAVIGDELRMPIAWCEMDSCISYYTDPVALGEADIRVRALCAGWRLDRFGLLVCLDCQQSNPWYRTAYPVVLWDRRAAVATAAMMAAALRHDGGHGGTHTAPSAVTPTVDRLAGPPAGQAIGGRHRKQQ